MMNRSSTTPNFGEMQHLLRILDEGEAKGPIAAPATR